MSVLEPYLDGHVEYFTVGARSDCENPVATAGRLLRDSWRFACTVRRGRYDLVHLNPSLGPKALLRDGLLLLIGKAMQKPVVVFVHGWDKAFWCGLLRRWSWLFRWVYDRADAFIVLASECERGLRLLGCSRPVFLQTAPVEDRLLQVTPRCENRFRAAESGSPINILFLARVEKEKGIYEALDAYQILRRQYRFLSLTIAGDGSELASARQYAAAYSLDGVRFTGRVAGSAKQEAYQSSDIYLFPSHGEGLPLSVLEAMACGLPIVSCMVGGLPDFFRNGTMGFLADSRDPQGLAVLLRHLIDNPKLRARMSEFNRRYARNKFNGPRLAARLERVYRFVLAGSH